jgi:hypothetical protein
MAQLCYLEELQQAMFVSVSQIGWTSFANTAIKKECESMVGKSRRAVK